jgi:hypothetical protein
MSLGSKKLPSGHLPEYTKRTPYAGRAVRDRRSLSTLNVAKIAAQAILDGWEVNLVEDTSPVFIDNYGRELPSPMVAFKGSLGPSECYNYSQVQHASYLPSEVPLHRVLYIRSLNNDITPVKMQRWETEVLRHLASMGIATT